MGKYISLGKYNKNFKYIILYIIIALFNNSLSGINYYTGFNELRLIDNNKFSKFSIIHQIFSCYLGTFLLSAIFYIFENKKIKKVHNKSDDNSIDSSRSRNPSSHIILIHKDIIKQASKRKSFLFFLLIIFFWILEEQVIEKYNCTLSHLDFWMFELLIIAYLNSKIFLIQIYKHHLFVLFLSLFPILFKIITIVLAYIGNEDIIYIKDNRWYLIPIGLIIYFPLITLKSYVIIKLKWYMDLKYISPNKL